MFTCKLVGGAPGAELCECVRFLPSLVRVVMVLGAGRGPLVRAALKAAQTAERDIKVYAVEKNPGALVTYALLPHPSIHPSVCFLLLPL